MMKKLLFFVLFVSVNLYPYSIVLVHLGNKLPGYTKDCIAQARLFNQENSIYLIVSGVMEQYAHSMGDQYGVTVIVAEQLRKTKEHIAFLKATRFNPGLWLYSSERFLYIYDLMCQYDLDDVFHLENDVMLYADIAELMPVFKEYYKGIAGTFDNDERCVPAFVYIANKNAMNELANCFIRCCAQGKTDMYTLGTFRKEYKKSIVDCLPIITPTYHQIYGLKSCSAHTTTSPQSYSNHIESFQSIFDGAALGQYLSGIDPNYHANGRTPGFVSQECLFNTSRCAFEWSIDAQGRKIPYLIFKGEKYRINNLHIHGKNLYDFKS